MTAIRVLMVDDHAVLREGLRHLLALRADIKVVGEAADGQTAIEQVQTLKPDVVLMDISMPGMNGLQATHHIRTLCPDVRVLILTQHDNREFVRSLLAAGAAGYVLKRTGGSEVVRAIREVHREGTYFSPAVARQMAASTLRPVRRPRRPLSEREREVLTLIADGLTNREIASRLCLSIKTVSAHRANLMAKLGIHKSTALVKYAIREGLVSL